MVVIALLSGCVLVPGPRHEVPEPDEPDEPVVCTVVASEVDVGEVLLGSGEVATASLSIRNACERDLELFDLELQDDVGAFSLGPPSSVFAPPGQALTVPVTFAPEGAAVTAGDYLAHLTIETNDPESPTIGVDLVGTARATALVLDPEVVDVGAPDVGCAVPVVFTVRNRSADARSLLTVALASSTEEATWDGLVTDARGIRVAPPVAIPGGGSVAIELAYAPLDAFQDRIFLELETDDPDAPGLVGQVVGTGKAAGENTDVYEQDDPPVARFRLSTLPVAARIEVTVDGVAFSGGWAYDAPWNTVEFIPEAVPAPKALVEIAYPRLPDCPE